MSALSDLKNIAKHRWPGHDFAKDCECKSCRYLRSDFLVKHFDVVLSALEHRRDEYLNNLPQAGDFR
jgi:hypothetical protein